MNNNYVDQVPLSSGQVPLPYGQALPPYVQAPHSYGQASPPNSNAPYSKAPNISQPAPPFSAGPNVLQNSEINDQPPPTSYITYPTQPSQFVSPQQIMPESLALVTGAVSAIILDNIEKDLYYKAKRARIALIVSFVFDILLIIIPHVFVIVILFNIVGILAASRFIKCLAITFETFMVFYSLQRLLLCILFLGFLSFWL